MDLNKKKIAVFTGKRGGFGAMLPIMKMIHADPDLTLVVIASDMHLREEFGKTLKEVEANIPVDYLVDMGSYGDGYSERAAALGRCILGLQGVLEDAKPDILLLLGDRGETLAAALCAVEMGIVVAHIQAGDISGGIDDIHRHAITKLSHLHFSQNEAQRRRVISLGEHPERVFNSGAPYIDTLYSVPATLPSETKVKFQIPLDSDFITILFHPDTYLPERAEEQMNQILEACRLTELYGLVIYPCSDPGYMGVIRSINRFAPYNKFRIHRSIEFEDFVNVLRHSKILVGNSSAGIIEAPYLNLPFILVGNRQDGREHASNVIKVDAKKELILSAIKAAMQGDFRSKIEMDKMPFGDGTATFKIFNVLKDITVDEKLFRKKITY